MKQARLYPMQKSATQSGRYKTIFWCLHDIQNPDHIVDTSLEWHGSAQTESQIQLTFKNRDEALVYAKTNHIEILIEESVLMEEINPKSYGDNFKATRKRF
jgi:hypothetical protein